MRTNYSNFVDNAIACCEAIAVIAFCALLGVFLTSCESESGRASRIPMEKVVIIDGITNISQNNSRDIIIANYKVKRIEQGVVTWISIPGKCKYEAGDTILYRFIQRQ
jgi:hypothetical protein